MTENSRIVAIVEGPGEKGAVPDLMRRILQERLLRYDISAPKPVVTNGKPKLLEKFEKFLRYARLENCDAILVLVDADDECPREKAESLAERASKLNIAVPVAIVYAKSEYETWFICSLSVDMGEGIRTRLGIPPSVNAPGDVERIIAAKEWLTYNMPSGRAYKPTSDQEPLTHHIDLGLAHSRSRSFRRLCHAVEELVQAMDSRMAVVTPGT